MTMDALEARARWHLELGYPPYPPTPGDEPPGIDDDDGWDGEYLGHVTCWKCGGEGNIVNCCDDLCHGQDWCMHGDNEMCPNCHGEGHC